MQTLPLRFSKSKSFIYLPALLDSQAWPWSRTINPYYGVCKAESSAWCESFHAFDGAAQVAFNKCDFSLLAALAYPSLDKEGCRISCDMMNLVFVIDEHTDHCADANTVRTQVDIVMDAIRNPHVPRPKNGEWVGGEIARQFWANAVLRITPAAQTRFVDEFQVYLDAVVDEAADRTFHRIRSIKDYFEIRRNTIGAKSSFAICEMYMNIPEEVIRHPVIEKLTELSIDMIIAANDICSYNVEQARGDDTHNLVTIVIHEFKTDLQSAINWIGELHDELATKFLKEYDNMPSFKGPFERDILAYCQNLGNWVQANQSWSFESERYFAKAGRRIQTSRKVRLLPKRGQR